MQAIGGQGAPVPPLNVVGDFGGGVLLARNPRLVYGSATGYGTSGPNRDFLAMDLTIQAMSGAMDVTGYPDREPLKAGPAISDFLGGVHLYAAIATALYERSVTGRGRVVEISMQEAMFPTLASNLTMYYEDPDANPLTGNRHGALALAPYNTYQARDGHVAIICVTEGHWSALARAMKREDLIADPRYASHQARCQIMEEVDQLVEAWTRQFTREQVMALGQAFHFPCAPVRNLKEVVHDAHMHQRGMLHDVAHPVLGDIVLPSSPLRFHGTAQAVPGGNPQLGEHNAHVFGELLGMSPARLDALREAGAF